MSGKIQLSYPCETNCKAEENNHPQTNSSPCAAAKLQLLMPSVTDVYQWFTTGTARTGGAALAWCEHCFYLLIVFFSEVTSARQLSCCQLCFLQASRHTHRDTHLEADSPDGDNWKPSQTLLGIRVFFPPVFLRFAYPPPSQILCVLFPPAIRPSISLLMASQFLSLGGSVCARAMISVISRWNPCCDSGVCSFAYQLSQAAAGDHPASPAAVSMWLVATWLPRKARVRLRRVLGCT